MHDTWFMHRRDRSKLTLVSRAPTRATSSPNALNRPGSNPQHARRNEKEDHRRNMQIRTSGHVCSQAQITQSGCGTMR